MSDYSNTCPQCGNPVPADARFCENCGASFPAGAAAAAPQPEGPAGGYGEPPAYEAEPAGGYGGAYGAGPQPGYNPAAGPEARYGSAPDNAYGGYGGYGGGYGGYGAAPVKTPLPDSFTKRYFEGFCGSPLYLTFVILISCQLLFQLFAGYGFIIQAIAAIVVCVGMWILFANSKTRNLTSTPISLIRGGLLAVFIVTIVVNGFAIIGYVIQTIFAFSNLDDIKESVSLYGSDIGGFVPVVLIFLIVLSVAKLLIDLLFYRTVLNSATSVRDTLTNGNGNLFFPGSVKTLLIVKIVLSSLSVIMQLARFIFSDEFDAYRGVLTKESSLYDHLVDFFMGTPSWMNGISIFVLLLSIAVFVVALMVYNKVSFVQYGPNPAAYNHEAGDGAYPY